MSDDKPKRQKKTNPDEFFEDQTQASKIKADLVLEYFKLWSSVMLQVLKRDEDTWPTAKLAYIDLFAGKGKYDDGTPSIPLLVMEQVVHTYDLHSRLIAVFNDGKPEVAEELRKNLDEVPGIKFLMKYQPQVISMTVDSTAARKFENMNLVPSLVVLDPFGYKGITADLIQNLIGSWGCDCIFFFNYRRVNAGITNDMVRPHLDALFGADKVEELRSAVHRQSPAGRERIIMHELHELLRRSSIAYTKTFRIKSLVKDVTSHYIVLATKHHKGYIEMAKFMAAKSSEIDDDGFASFEFNPHLHGVSQIPIKAAWRELADSILKDYAGKKRLNIESVFLEHSRGKNYTLANYRKVLYRLLKEGKIKANRDPKQEDSFAPDIIFEVLP